jgi:uncharacterized protein (UPF0261 family)
MMVVHTVVDIIGLNPVSTTVFDNVAAAVAAMARGGNRLEPRLSDSRLVGVTMLGNTTRAVMAARDRLAEHGYEAVVFHSNGVGGPAMEELAEAGLFVGVIDFTTNEVTDPMVGGIHDGGPRRLSTVAELGIPQIVVPGCIDFSVFASGHVPSGLAGLPQYDHNPEYTLVRTPASLMAKIGELFAARLNRATGPLVVAIPTNGLSIPNVPDGVFWDPAADQAFAKSLRKDLRADIAVLDFDHHVNDPRFGEVVADLFAGLLDGAGVSSRLETAT